MFHKPLKIQIREWCLILMNCWNTTLIFLLNRTVITFSFPASLHKSCLRLLTGPWWRHVRRSSISGCHVCGTITWLPSHSLGQDYELDKLRGVCVCVHLQTCTCAYLKNFNVTDSCVYYSAALQGYLFLSVCLCVCV